MPTRLTSVVIDSADPAALGRWWAEALGWPITYADADEVVVEPEDTDTPVVPALVFVPVDDPKVVQNRVHLDLASDSAEHQAAIVERLVAAGAQPVDVGQGDAPWVVLADPEGNELCVLEARDRHRGVPLASIVLQVVDVEAQARFWSAASGWPVRFLGGGVASLHNPARVLPDLDLVTVPEPKVVKHRLHLDVAPFPDDDHAAEVARLEALGARRADVGQGDLTWVVLADPEGGELCVLSPR